jgi:hypothetical protein
MTITADDLDDLIGDAEAPQIAPDPEPEQPKAKRKDRRDRHPFDDWTDEDIEEMEELSWLVGDDDRPILLQGALWQTYGQKKSAKTYYCLEIAFCVAFGLKYHGMPTQQGKVVYILAEGGMKRNYKRVRALFVKYKAQMADKGYETLRAARATGNLVLIDQTIALADNDPKAANGPTSFADKIMESGTPPVLVVLDTWARAMWESGGHDSSADTVGPSIQACEAIRRRFGNCTLIMVAHVGVSATAQKRAKGLNDPAGAVDGGTLLEKSGSGSSAVFTATAMDQRHTMDGYQFRFSLKKSEAMEAAVTVPPSLGNVKLSAGNRTLFDLLMTMPDGTTVDQWREAALERKVLTKSDGEPVAPDSVRKAITRAQADLTGKKLISVDKDGVITIIHTGAGGTVDGDDEDGLLD